MKKCFILIISLLCSSWTWAENRGSEPGFYRELTHRLSTVGSFTINMVGAKQHIHFKYSLAKPIYAEPIVSDARLGLEPRYFFRAFWDRIFLAEGSYLEMDGERLPLTCIFINGQDNRYANISDPRIPQVLMRIYLVTKDKTCVGPMNPNYPHDGTIPETWDNYLYYELKHPETLVPNGARLRRNWNDLFIDHVGWN